MAGQFAAPFRIDLDVRLIANGTLSVAIAGESTLLVYGSYSYEIKGCVKTLKRFPVKGFACVNGELAVEIPCWLTPSLGAGLICT